MQYSELLAAAISRSSTVAIQGSAGVTDDQIKYSWNYALLLAEGSSPRALVPAPLYVGMREGATSEGTQVEKPASVMSTAEAVSVAMSAGLDAYYYGGRRHLPAHPGCHPLPPRCRSV